MPEPHKFFACSDQPARQRPQVPRPIAPDRQGRSLWAHSQGRESHSTRMESPGRPGEIRVPSHRPRPAPSANPLSPSRAPALQARVPRVQIPAHPGTTTPFQADPETPGPRSQTNPDTHPGPAAGAGLAPVLGAATAAATATAAASEARRGGDVERPGPHSAPAPPRDPPRPAPRGTPRPVSNPEAPPPPPVHRTAPAWGSLPAAPAGHIARRVSGTLPWMEALRPRSGRQSFPVPTYALIPCFLISQIWG